MIEILSTIEDLEHNLSSYLRNLFGEKSGKPIAQQISDITEKVKILVDHTNTLTTGKIVFHTKRSTN